MVIWEDTPTVLYGVSYLHYYLDQTQPFEQRKAAFRQLQIPPFK